MFYKDLAIYLSYGLPSFSSSYSLVLLLQNKWQACQERGRNFPKLFMKWLAPSSLNPVGTLSSTRNTIITLSVPLPGSPHKNRFCDDEGVCATLNLPSTATTCTVLPVPGNSCSTLQGGTLLCCPSPLTAGVQGCWQCPVWAF